MDFPEMIAELKRMIPLNGQVQARWNETDAWIDAIVHRVQWLQDEAYQKGMRDGWRWGHCDLDRITERG